MTVMNLGNEGASSRAAGAELRLGPRLSAQRPPFFKRGIACDAPTRRIYPLKNAGSWRRLAEGGGT